MNIHITAKNAYILKTIELQLVTFKYYPLSYSILWGFLNHMGVTIKDVAKSAGVSKATVSRVINDSPLIPSETKEKVRKIMGELEYFPNSIARSFAHQSTYAVALIVDVDNTDAFANPFFYQVQYGIEKVVCKRGYNLMIANEKTMTHHETVLNRLVLEKRVDGIIFPASLLSKSLVKKMEKESFPFIVIGEPEEGFSVNWVDINNRMAGELATEHLIRNGYKRIAFILSSSRDIFNKNRLFGYQSSLERNNFIPDPQLIKNEASNKEQGYIAMKELLRIGNPPDAVVVTNNIAAFGALTAVKEAGYKVPGDFGLVSFDNYPVAEFSEPNMTTVDINVFDLGVQAATMLFKEIETPSAVSQHSLLSVKIIPRGSGERAASKEVVEGPDK